MGERFDDMPVSVAEARAHRSYRASDWLPRDALVNLLRDIDAGRVHPDTLFIAYRDVQGESRSSRFVAVGKSGAEIVGTATIALNNFLRT